MALSDLRREALRKIFDNYKDNDNTSIGEMLDGVSTQEQAEAGKAFNEWIVRHGEKGLSIWSIHRLMYFLEDVEITEDSLNRAVDDELQFTQNMSENAWLMNEIDKHGFKLNDDNYLVRPCEDPCQRCGGCCYGDGYSVVIGISAGVFDMRDWCFSCYESRMFYCDRSGEYWSTEKFECVESSSDDYTDVCLEYVRDELGWVYNDEKAGWEPPPGGEVKTAYTTMAASSVTAYITGTTTTVTLSPTFTVSVVDPTGEKHTMYKDFYWQLRKGKTDRVLVLMKEDGDEDAGEKYEKKVYKAIEDAGADKGDPDVLNVYTRLQLIADKLLPETYRLESV